jgi:general secretion pathway protein H
MRKGNAKGFTLLEVMLVLVVIAVGSMLIMPSWRSEDKTALQEGERIKAQIEYLSDRAAMEGRPFAFSVATDGWQLLSLKSDPQEQDKLSWVPFSTTSSLGMASRWPEDWHIKLAPQGMVRLARSLQPQIYILPDGQITPFTLSVIDRNSRKPLFTLTSKGTLPLSLVGGAK